MEFQDRKQLLAQSGRRVGIRITLVEEDGFLQAVEVRRTIGAAGKMSSDQPTGSWRQILVEIFLKLSCHGMARRCMFVTVRHCCGCRNRAAALLPDLFE